MKEFIIFGGDSFTWGEGLELYINSETWINERKLKNHWEDLHPKQTKESILFRESNRYAGLVEKKLGYKSIVKKTNGGGFDDGALWISKHIKNKPKAVFLQLTALQRINFHFSRLCKCEICNHDTYGNVRPIAFYIECLSKLINKEKFTESDMYFLNYLKEIENIKLDLKYIDEVYELFSDMIKRSTDVLINEYIKEWEKTTKVYLIDSWEIHTQELIKNNEELYKRLISLKGYDGKYYKNYSDWEKTFPYKRIGNQFPQTTNMHPTLLQHKYLSESIIEKLQ